MRAALKTLGIVTALALTACVVGSIALYLIFHHPQMHFDPGTPGNTVEEYLAATDKSDYGLAYGFFTTEAQAQMPVDKYLICGRRFSTHDNESNISKYHSEGNETEVTLKMTIFYSGSHFTSPTDVYSYDVSVRMVRESGNWKFDELMVLFTPIADRTPRLVHLIG